MAVEASHHNLFPPQLIQNRELSSPIVIGNGAYAYNAQQMRFLGIPSAAALPGNQFFHQPAVLESVQAKTSVNTDSGVTYNISDHKKRSRDCFNQFQASQGFMAAAPQKMNGLHQLPPLAGEDILPHIQRYQFDIDSIISQHTKKIKLELEERQKHQARLVAAAISEGLLRKLKEKDEQIQRIGKLNLVLQERVKSLYAENQLWRDLAQTNEATANNLRSNLEQLLQNVTGGEERDDAESCCSISVVGDDADDGNSSPHGDRRCRMCKGRDSSVVFLPCRHLCLCSVCGSGSRQLPACPACNAAVTATLHVNMS